MSARPKLLFLSQILPYPPDSGVAIRTYNILRILARRFDVTALCFYREKAHRTGKSVPECLEALSELGKIEAFPIPQEHNRARLVLDHARSVMMGRPYTNYTYQSEPFTRRLRRLLCEERFHLVHMDSLDLGGYLPMVRHLPVVCVHHNVESLLMRRRAAAEMSIWKRRYLNHQADLLEEEERRWCPAVALNVTVSQADQETLKGITGPGQFAVVPNGVDVDEYQPQPGSEQSQIVYLGGTEWFPNLDALEFFGAEILPLLHASMGSPSIRWIGRASPEEQRVYRDRYGVELTGYVDDIRPFVHQAACTIVPLRIGGGTRLKITTAWALGKAVVSTSVGCEGLAATDGENILIRDTPAEFASAVEELLNDVSLRRRIAEGARRSACEIYSWTVIGDRMLDLYLPLGLEGGR